MRGACASRAIASQRPDFGPRLSGTEARLTLAHAAVRRQVGATSATDFESLPCLSSRSWDLCARTAAPMIAAAPMAIAAALSLAVACLWYWLQSVPPVTLRASYLPPPAWPGAGTRLTRPPHHSTNTQTNE